MTPENAKASSVWTDIRHILIGCLLDLILWVVPKDACGIIIIKYLHAMSRDIVETMELEDERNSHTRLNPHN